ncbi:MAG: lytic murein transglycosylase, partial [Betaproteobacteria bacterium]
MAQVPDMAQRRGLDPRWLRKTLAKAHFLPTVARLITPPPQGVAKNWRAYRERFIEPVRIQAGVRFWQANAHTLERAESEYGVPAQLIVGIIGVETVYGQQMGSFRVIDALATLAFDFPKAHPRALERSAYFKSELEQFLQLSQRARTDPLAMHGSYAGAMGMAQFMPSSWARYAVDFDGDGRIDLLHSPPDVIGSVANYFKAFQWQSGMAEIYPVQLDAATLDLDALLLPDILPTFS